MLSRVAAPVALFAVGTTVATAPMGGVAGMLVAVVIGKLVFHPLVMAGSMAIMPGIDPLTLGGGIIFAAVPMLSIYPLIAHRAGMHVLAASALLAALLFDLPGLRAAVAGELAASHPAVRGLLEGQDAADPVWALHAGREAGRNGEGLRRLLLAIIQDLRVVPILLARQLAKMRVADRLPEAERRALAQLTRDLHAPLANRLGIWQLKWELEDLAFRQML